MLTGRGVFSAARTSSSPETLRLVNRRYAYSTDGLYVNHRVGGNIQRLWRVLLTLRLAYAVIHVILVDYEVRSRCRLGTRWFL